ncbi:MAG TPA: glycosyltransferase [Solirubrobacterales bacterium]|nr:glycosyltransferase [Solirubrobacterales bacterium]
MKVLISTDTVGGVLTYTAELAAALEAAGDEVVVATMGPRLRRAQREALPSRLHESGCRLEWMQDPWGEVEAAGRWLLRLEEAERPDVVHLCSYAHAALPFQAPKVLVAHSCVLSWWRAVHNTEAPPSWNRYREEMSAGLAAADAVIAPTAAMLQELERDHPLDPDRTQVIHNGSASTPPSRATSPELHQLDHLPGGQVDAVRDGGLFVLGSGRFWDAAKNLAALDAAAAGLAWPVVVAGDLGDGPAPQHARGTGQLDGGALARLRRAAAIYAAPAVYEPFGLGILEAARDRCALVLGDIPSLRELWEDAAIFVDPRDHDGLREVLACLIETPRLREDLAERAQRRAGDYSIARATSAYRALYRRLAESERSSPRIPGTTALGPGVHA